MQTLRQHKQYLLTGVSYVIPMIACGGILIATAIALLTMLHPGAMTPSGGPDFSQAPTLKVVLDIGDAAFKLALPVLAGFISYGMAGKPGLVPGLIGGYLAGTTNAGFLGALLVGLVAGHVVTLLKKLPVHKVLRPIMPIIVIPIVSSLVVGVVMLKVVGVPIAGFMTFLAGWLQTLNQGNAIVLAAILGAMIAFDMGGPVNKAAFFFGAAMIKEGQYAVMGACAAAICTPPLGLALATLAGRRLWTEEQRESGLAALGMGMVGITEGAIPFAAADPVRVIPSIMLGSMVAATIAMLGGVGDHAPHGGPIVLPVVDNRVVYLLAIAAGTAVTALAINLLKASTEKPAAAPEGALQ
ncbi:MAG: PTS fructose-like transporter subunit EIIC [Acidobacteria bacterium]|nr:MAG: PTS fructose-like transporter subunit EIIC [Acidobacteriota bacterium]